MIHFMPFTFVAEPLLDRLHAVFGTLAVCPPLMDQVPDHMRKAADDGWLHLSMPQDIDQKRLRQSLTVFTEWAVAHGGRAGDLMGFFRSRQMDRHGRGAGPDEADAHQIRAQLRRRTDGVPPETDHPEFEAALFLCLAHTYDQQQETLNRDLGKVQVLEENFSRILGETDTAQRAIGPALTNNLASDPGAHMTQRRLASWARIVLPHTGNDSCFVTTSTAVMQDIQECGPDIRPVARIPIAAENGRPSLTVEALRRGLAALIAADDPGAAATDLFPYTAPETSGPRLVVNAVQGCAPHDFVFNYIDKKQDDIMSVSESSPSRNTVIVHFVS